MTESQGISQVKEGAGDTRCGGGLAAALCSEAGMQDGRSEMSGRACLQS